MTAMDPRQLLQLLTATDLRPLLQLSILMVRRPAHPVTSRYIPSTLHFYYKIRDLISLKGIVNVISSDPRCKDVNARFLSIHLKPYLMKKRGKYRRFLTVKVFFSVIFSIDSHRQEMRKSLSQKSPR